MEESDFETLKGVVVRVKVEGQNFVYIQALDILLKYSKTWGEYVEAYSERDGRIKEVLKEMHGID